MIGGIKKVIRETQSYLEYPGLISHTLLALPYILTFQQFTLKTKAFNPTLRTEMPEDYQRVALLAEEDDSDKETLHETTRAAVPSDSESTSHISIDKRILVILALLIFFNLILAATTTYYSNKMADLLLKYEDKDLASLPRIDPFNGAYRNITGKILFRIDSLDYTFD